jgi:transposase-like protein
MIGVRPDGTKELIVVEDGYQESKESWSSLLRDLKRRGMEAPVLAIGDGALGFWAGVRDVWPETREQAEQEIERFKAGYGAKYPKAVAS